MQTFLMQALASYLAIAAFLVVLQVPKRLLAAGSGLGMAVWLLFLLLSEICTVVPATFLAAIAGSIAGQLMSRYLKTPSTIFSLAILAPLVPGYRSYLTATYFVTGQYKEALVSTGTVLTLALIIPIGMACGTILVTSWGHVSCHFPIHRRPNEPTNHQPKTR